MDRLLSDLLWRSDLFEIAGMPRRMHAKKRVRLDSAPGKYKGDIDVLLSTLHHPEHAVAYQVKRIKFGIPALRTGGRPNKMQELEKAAQQANLLARIGFWQIYL